MSDQPAETKVCPKCGGGMELGSIYAATARQSWQKKGSLRDKFLGHSIVSFACTQCGYLESYLESKN